MNSSGDASEKILFLPRALLSVFILIACSLLVLVFSILTLFQCRSYLNPCLVSPTARLILSIWGIQCHVHHAERVPEERFVAISNHSSTLDLFLLLALGLPRTRFFLWGGLRVNPFLALIGYLIGVFWTAPQTDTEQRRRIFEAAGSSLLASGESVFLSPEGTRVDTGDIGPFNKGAFHMAIALGAPILPIFIAIPRRINPGRGYFLRPGEVHIYYKPLISTGDWKLEELIEQKEKVRSQYIEWNREHIL